MGSASVGGMSHEFADQPQKFKKGPWSSRNRQGRDDFSCEKGRSENGDPSRNLRFQSPIEEMGFYTPAGARWARRISSPTAHAAHPGCVWALSRLRLGSVWALSGLRLGSVWTPSGLRLDSVWTPSGLCPGSVWAPSGLRPGSVPPFFW